MARPVGLSSEPSTFAAVRTVTGSPVAPDSSTLSDANFPPSSNDTTGGAINAYGMSTLWVGVELTGGSAPTVTIEALVRDAGAADGSRWKRLFTSVNQPQTYTLDGTGLVEVRVDGRLVFLRITAVTGNPTSVKLLAIPGAMQPRPGFW